MVEGTWDRAGDGPAQSWFAVLLLDRFGLTGDPISNYLFGLTKQPTHTPRFADRGVPADASHVVRLLVADDERFFEKHGEGTFGHSYASLTEIEDALRDPNAPEVANSEWKFVLDAVQSLTDVVPPIPREQWRVIVWADW